MTTYLGFDVLETEPNRIGAVEDTIERRFEVHRSPVGERFIDEMRPAPSVQRPFVWTAIGPAECAEVRAFVDARRGRRIPFWVPTWQHELTLAEEAPAGSAGLTIQHVRYAQQMFAGSLARRHLWIYERSEGHAYHEVVDATDPENGVDESLTIAPVTARVLTLGTLVGFLRFCRLETDLVEWEWESTSVLHAVIRVRELPREVPSAV